jgi:alanine-synthesizing transaminase
MNRIEQTRQRLMNSGRRIVNLSSGNPNEFGIYFDQKILEDAYAKFLRDRAYKPDPKGDLRARQAIQKFYASRGLMVSPEQIILTSGSSESYFHLFKMLAKPGEKILFPKPSYPLFEEIARLAEIETGFYNLDEKDGWQIDCENLETKMRDDVKAIALISPGNPTGAVLSEKTLSRVVKIAIRHQLPIISDEVFSEYMFDGKRFPRMAEIALKAETQYSRAKSASGAPQPTVFTLNGFSKTYALPGLKLSWIVVTGPSNRPQKSGQPQRSPSYIEQLERSADALLSTNQISQAMAPVIIKKGQRFIKKLNRYLQKNRDLAVKTLGANPNITFHVPEGGFYLFVRIRGLEGRAGSWLRRGRGHLAPTQAQSACGYEHSFAEQTQPLSQLPARRLLSDEDLVIALMEKTGIFVHPGYFYDYDKGINILISLLPPEDNFEDNLKKILKFIS